VQSADVFPGGRRLESLLVREAAEPGTGGLQSLFETTAVRVDEAFERIGRLERRLHRLESSVGSSQRRELEYLVFLATASGYRLEPAFGRLPVAGERLGADADVLRVGVSPLPGDSRPCVFAIAGPLGCPDAGETDAAPARRAA